MGQKETVHTSKACLEASSVEGGIRREAEAKGMTLRVNEVRCGRRAVTTHWMFDGPTGRRLLDYWPGSGTWRAADGGRGEAGDPLEALAEAEGQLSPAELAAIGSGRNLERQVAGG